MRRQDLKKKKIPDVPGVYIFRDYRGRPLYIGRATSLHDRVKSYFSTDILKTRGLRVVDMTEKAKRVTWQTTDSVLEAVLLESRLIKRYQPFYNVDERDDKSDQYVLISDEEWPRVYLERARNFEKSDRSGVLREFGPFPNSFVIKEAMRILRKMFPFRDKKSTDSRHERFYRSLGVSPDKDGEEAHAKYKETISYLIMFFEGKKSVLLKKIEKKMDACAQAMRFEEANQYKKLLHALKHIQDIALIKANGVTSTTGLSPNRSTFRMEAFDIAHMSGTNVVGSMVVSIDGIFAKNEYRKFKISKEKNDDTGALRELLNRRLNHTEWAYPDLIVIDGGIGQLNTALEVLQARRINIPLVAVTKDERHKASEIIGDAKSSTDKKEEIISLNSESHRFTIGYHRKRRGMSFLK